MSELIQEENGVTCSSWPIFFQPARLTIGQVIVVKEVTLEMLRSVHRAYFEVSRIATFF
jgi:hypothetical protein